MASRNTPRPGRDVVTLADLSPKREITGGSSQRVFGADPIEPARAKPAGATKDLAPKAGGTVKGGRLVANDNITLVSRLPSHNRRVR
jgi:hypothetical protein